jgi:hypothetical protein
MIDKIKLFKFLNFSGDKDSWFDFWHTHADWNGEGNTDWELRIKFIDELFDFYNECKIKLSSYPQMYQLFIFILENDSSQDAVYIHTKNPNQNNFPLKLSSKQRVKIKNEKLYQHLKSFGLQIIINEFDQEVRYYLSDQNVGLPLLDYS